MHVVISTYTYLPDIGGVSTFVSGIAKALVEFGDKVSIVTSTHSTGEDHLQGVNVIRGPSAAELLHLYRSSDLLVACNSSLKLGWPLLVRNEPYLLINHSESNIFPSGSSWKRWLKRRIVGRAENLYVSAYLCEQAGQPKSRLIPLFADPTIFNHRAAHSDIVDPSTVLFVGRLEPEKGIKQLVAAISRLLQVRPSLRMRIVGDGSLRSWLEARISEGNAQGLEYLGPRDAQSVAREMRKCAVLVVPSIWNEPAGLVCLEGIASGAIVVASRRGGIPELVGACGLLFNPDDESDIVHALLGGLQMSETHRSSPDAEIKFRLMCEEHTRQFSAQRAAQVIRSFEK
jgi:glycogen synthase